MDTSQIQEQIVLSDISLPPNIILSRFTIAIDDSESRWFANTRYGTLARIKHDALQNPNLINEVSLFLHNNGFAISSANDNEIFQVQKNLQEAKSAVNTLDITLAPTLGCNFSCYYCFERKTNQFKDGDILNNELENKILSVIFSNLRGREGLNLRWFGGEPLKTLDQILSISQKLISVCDLAEKKYSAYIQTNGLLLTEFVSDALVSVRITDIQITIDGNEDSHNSVRTAIGYSNSYKTILENIKKALPKFKNIIIRVNVTEKNCRHIDKLLYDLSLIDPNRKLSIYAAPIYSHYNGKSMIATTSVGFTGVEEFANFEIEFFKYLLELGYSFSWNFIQPKDLPCSALKVDAVMIGPDGNIYKCDHELGVPELRSGHVSTGVDQIDKLAQWIAIHPKDNEFCSECPLLPSCLGYCASVRSFSKSSTQACPSKKFNYESRLQLGIENLHTKGLVDQELDFQIFLKPLFSF
jgi:radical SAM additional 4Fe4S-binding domain